MATDPRCRCEKAAMTDAHTPSPEAAPAPSEKPRAHCYGCGAGLAEPGADTCHACGRRQTRECRCGAAMPRSAQVCPECGADRPESRRRRRSRRSSRQRRKRILTHAATGAIIALVLLAIGVGVWRIAPEIAEAVRNLLADLEERGDRRLVDGAIALLAVTAVGAIVGVVWYYISESGEKRKRGKKPRPQAE